MRKTIVMALAFVIVISCTFVSAETSSDSFELAPGSYIVGKDILPGWYRLAYVDGEYSSAYVYTNNVLDITSVPYTYHYWYAEDGSQYPAEAVPLLDGCLVIIGDMNDGKPDYSTGNVSFKKLGEFSEYSKMPESPVSFTVGAGEYIAGVDFPVGAYSIKAAGSGSFSFVNYDIFDESGKRIFNGVLQNDEYVAHSSEQYGVPFNATSLGKVDFKDGWRYIAEVGNSRFETYTGIVFD